mgnify:CR=1 FL=1
MLLFVLGLSSGVYEQSREDLEQKRKNLDRQIKKTTYSLQKTIKNRRATLQNLNKIEQRIQTRRELIGLMQQEVQALNQLIDRKMGVIEVLQQNLQRLKASYTKVMRLLYRYQLNNNGLLFIVSAESFQKAYLRWIYLQQIEKRRKLQVEYIRATQQSLSKAINSLEQQKLAKANLLDQELAQQATLDQELKEKNTLAKKLKSKERQLRYNLKRKERYKNQLNKKIEQVIRAEIAAAKRAARRYKSAKSSTPTTTHKPAKTSPKSSSDRMSQQFRLQKGRLPFPVERGSIVSYYGRQSHPIFNQVTTVNNGIDIRGTKKSKVRCVYAGKVVSVFTIPGFNNAVMVKHGEYYTTYSNLSSVFVKRGDAVSQSDAIGRDRKSVV